MMSQLTLERGAAVDPALGLSRAEHERRERTHLENLWQDTVEPFKVIGAAWKNDRQQFTQETLRAINLAFNPVLTDEHGKRYFNGRSLIYWTGLSMLIGGTLAACKALGQNSDGGGITPGSKTPTPTPESLCPDLIGIAAANSVDVGVSVPVWQAAAADTTHTQLNEQLSCFTAEIANRPVLSVGEVIPLGPEPGNVAVQLAWSRGGEVKPLLAVPGAQIDDLQLVNFLDPHTGGQWEALSPDQARTQLAAVNINSASGDIEAEESGAMITATRDFNGNISFQIVNPDGTQAVLTADQIRDNPALASWLTQVENLLKGQEILTFDVAPGIDVGNIGEKYSLPQEVFAVAREKHLAPIEAEGSIAAACTTDSCTVMLTDVLVSGAKLQPASDGKVSYGFDGEAGSEALFRFNGLPEGVRPTAFVAQEGNPWGFKAGTVVVWFWEGGAKGPTQILNLDNPLRIMADSPNSIQVTSADNGFIVTTTDANGTVIDEQRVAFLPPLPSEFLSQIPKDSYVYDANGLHITLAEGQVIDIPQDQIAEKFQGEVFILDLNQQSESGYQLGVIFRNGQWRETVINFPFETNGENINNFPEIILEDITSGRLAEAERLASQPFPEGVEPLNNYYYDSNFNSVYPNFDPQTGYEFSLHPEEFPMRFVYFYQAEINNIPVVMATLQVLNQDYSSIFIHYVESRKFINSYPDYWNKVIRLQRRPTFDMALGGDKYDICGNGGWSKAVTEVTCPLNAPKRDKLQTAMQELVEEQSIPEELEEVLFVLSSGRW